jgi:hypothetical protein
MTTKDPTGSRAASQGPDPTDAAPSSSLLRVRAAALAELRRRPRAVSWRRDVARTLLLVLGTSGAVIGAAAWFSIVDFGRIPQRALSVVLLVGLQALGLYAALAPGKAALRWCAAVMAALAAVAMVLGRGSGAGLAAPGVPCSAVHLGIDLIPLGLVLVSLRRFSFSLGRSLLAGAAAAATGALAGELSCSRGWTHALIHHVGAGLVVAMSCVLLSRMLRPQTFAP